MKVLTVNIDGIRTKKHDVAYLISEHDPDVFIGNETKLCKSVQSQEVFPDGYHIYRKDRKSGGGGVLIAVKDSLASDELTDLDTPCEIIWTEVQAKNNKIINIGTFYRPPHSDPILLDHLHESLIKMKTRYPARNIILSGDLNLGGIEWETGNIRNGASDVHLCRKLIDICDEFGLQQMVSEPTHRNSILDVFLTSTPGLVEKCIVGPGISDHDLIVTDTLFKAQIYKKPPRKIHQYKKADWDQIDEDLSHFEETFFADHPSEKTVEENWTNIKSALNNAIDKNIPTKIIRNFNSLPWVTRDVKHHIRRKNRAHKKAKHTKRPRDWARFRKLRKQCHQEMKKAYWVYLNHIIEPTAENNSKPFWKFIKSRRQDHTGVSTLKHNGKIASDSKSKAEMLNHQFCSVFTEEDINNMPDKGPSPYPDMSSITISRTGVHKILINLNPSKASGPDEISAKILKQTADRIAGILSFIFQHSINTGTVPSDWKKANVVPLFKKGSKSCPANYRPVSLTAICCKILEHIITTNIWSHLDNHNIINCFSSRMTSQKYSTDLVKLMQLYWILVRPSIKCHINDYYQS